MPTRFTVTLEMGPGVYLSSITATIKDLDVVGDGALGMAEVQAASDARRSLIDAVAREGPDALVARGRQLETLGNESEQVSEELRLWEQAFFDDEGWFHPKLFGRGRLRRSAFGEALFGPSGGWPLSTPSVSRFIQRLLAAETARRLPQEGFRVERLHYENPVAVEILAEVGVAATALAVLLQVIRDWSARMRRENARAHAEERIQAARAADAEDQAIWRMQLRRLLLEEIASGRRELSDEAVRHLLTDDVADAAHRLADRDLRFTRTEIPGP